MKNHRLKKQPEIDCFPNATRILLTTDQVAGGDEHVLMLEFPAPVAWIEAHPVFEYFGAWKALAYRATPDPEFQESRSFKDLWAENPYDICQKLLKTAIAIGLESDNPSARARAVIDGFFATSEVLRPIDPEKPLSIESAASTVVLDFPGTTVWQAYDYKDWEGIIDPITGTQGTDIGHTFKLCEDVTVEDGRFVPSVKLFSSMMRKCVVFPENTRPTRLLVTRPVFAQHEELVNWEDPLVAHRSYQSGVLRGRHLLTAILTLPEGYQDCLLISRTGAKKLQCRIHRSKVIQDDVPVQLKVAAGNRVSSGSILALSDMGTVYRMDRHWVPSWKIQAIVESDALIGGKLGKKYRFEFATTLSCRDGDKLNARFGGKGVVIVLEDSEMPVVKETNEIVDLVVNPVSFVSRRNLSALREMVVNRLFWKQYLEANRKTVVQTDHFSEELSLPDLLDKPESKPVELLIDGKSVYAMTGPLYWLRTDKHAAETVAVAPSGPPILNGSFMKPESSRLSGKRLTMNYFTVLEALGMQKTAESLMSSAVVPETMQHLERIIRAVTGR